MIRLKEFSVEEIIGFINDGDNVKETFVVNDQKYKVGLSSLRLLCFKRSLVCVSCGRIGNLFALEKSVEKDITPHFNLYHKDDKEEILMTQDHIFPKSKGGAHCLENLQTMCFKCNHKKGNAINEGYIDVLLSLIKSLIDQKYTDNQISNILANSETKKIIGFNPLMSDMCSIIRQLSNL